MEARKLQAKEISCRVQQITADGLSLLLYITSRAAMNLMDDTFGALMWKRESREVNGDVMRETYWKIERAGHRLCDRASDRAI